MIAVARVSGVFGVKGWLRIFSYTRPPGNLLDYRPWCIKSPKGFEPFPVAELDFRGDTLICRLEGIDVREVAADWVGTELYIRRDQLPALAAGEYYWSDLIGLEVRNLQGEVLGEVTRLLETGAHDVLVVRGDREHLIPYVMGVHVQAVEPNEGRLIVDWEADY